MPEADPHRIARFLREVGEVGKDPRGGWSRLAFSQEERQAHALFERWAADLALSVRTDAIGNTFAEFAGNDDSRPALMSGSLLDTVPQGGGFDGSVCVAAALEVTRLLSETGGLSRPNRAVVFSTEEGTSFGTPCVRWPDRHGRFHLGDAAGAVRSRGALRGREC